MQRCTREDAKHVGKKHKVVGEVVVAGDGVVFTIEHHASPTAQRHDRTRVAPVTVTPMRCSQLNGIKVID